MDGQFRRCPDCHHENHLFGCECTNNRCICYKKRTAAWNNQAQVNGSGLWLPKREGKK